MKITLKVWRQKNREAKGEFKIYQADHVSSDMSFLEMLDVLNTSLIKKGEEPIHFDHDCREGICGMCIFYINGTPLGPFQTTPCQFQLLTFVDAETFPL